MSSEDAVIEEELKERWDDLTSWMTNEVKTSWWKRIVAAYREPHRRFHNMEHIYQMFQHYDANKDTLIDRYAVAYAIFFHDIIYDPRQSTNEAQSADVVRRFSKETTLDSASYVTRLIEATATHRTDVHMTAGQYGTEDAHYLLDFDMAALGSDPHDYETFSQQIREEYAHLEDHVYAVERSKALQQFLEVCNIYATEAFRDNYEAKARRNIQAEIDSLKAKVN